MNSPTIIKNQNAFTDYFFKVKGKKITIVSAFASETTEVVERMLASGNTVDVIVGTINSFTSPKFIGKCKEIAKDNKNIKFSVDFRYESSVHWKLYLISPSTVIIGSANFTQTGLTFERDTCVAIQDKKLYDDYLGMVAELKDKVIESTCEEFDARFKVYRANHKKMQAAIGRGRKFKDFESWLKEESNQQIPLCVCKRDHNEDEKKQERYLLEKHSDGIDFPESHDFLVFYFSEYKENELPYEEGSIILYSGPKGGHLGFFRIDKIISDEECETHILYYFNSTRNTSTIDLFPITDESKKKYKSILKPKKLKYRTYLTKDELREIFT